MIKYIPRNEYEALWEECKASIRPEYDSSCDFIKSKEQIAIDRDKAYNPDMPREIQYWEKEGLVIYRPQKD